MTLNFQKGFIPAIIQDAASGKVLMLGYMNEQSFAITKEKKRVTFFSRSRQKLWMKGETSGNYLEVKEIFEDCDQDTILIKAIPAGPVCHTGADTCFSEKNESGNFLSELEKVISQRRLDAPDNSYTAKLFAQGINKIAQKLGEEAVELIIEAKDSNDGLFKNEAADLIYHFMVLLRAKNIELDDILETLKERHR
jgi:phosphoribosyl-AMP cyclohydrolase / phosphoribosyl-ATP pyrophosphohydrolase